MRSLVLLLWTASAVVAAEPGLIGWWTFDGEGATIRDRSPLGNPGRLEGGRRVDDGGPAIELDGIDGRVVIDLARPLGVRDAVTVAIWVKPLRHRSNTLFCGVPHPTPEWTTPGCGFYSADGRVIYGMWLGEGRKVLVHSPEPLALGCWSQLVATADGTTARLFINGRQVAESPYVGPIVLPDQPLLIGRGLGSKPALRGAVADVRYYDRALSTDAVAALFAATRGGRAITPPATNLRDGTVPVEVHGRNPEADVPWVAQPTRILDLLEGYQPAPAPPLDRYGGRTDLPGAPPTGFFETARIDGRDWLITPEGHRFFHVAVNAVREPRGLAERGVTPDQWADGALRELRAIGFNGLGNWSTARVTDHREPLVWVLRWDFMFSFARDRQLVEAAAGTQGFVNRCMPVFHPEFEAHCRRFAEGLAATRDNPWLLGIMTDNELQCPVDLLDRCLDGAATHADLAANQAEAERWLRERGWRGDRATITARDRYEFIAHAFERYYQVVVAAIREVDPNHLYLGSRLNYSQGQFDNPYLWRAMAPYHDVVSVNYYTTWGPDPLLLADWAAWGAKPLLFTEWYAKALDPPGLANTHGAGWLVRTQEDRGKYYQHFALASFEAANVVGYHFFKYLDDPATSTALDSAGGANKGLYTFDGRPHQVLVDWARPVNEQAYRLIDFFARRR